MGSSHAADAFVAGLATGAFQAAAYNPWDRALFLSVAEARVFLHAENFLHPFHGTLQSLTHRTVAGGSYFALQEQFQRVLVRRKDGATSADDLSRWERFAVGAGAGTINGMVLNPLSAIKYHAWTRVSNPGKKEVYNFARSAGHMWKHGSSPFPDGHLCLLTLFSLFSAVHQGVQSRFPGARWRHAAANLCSALRTS
jgi:hypothetical protein